MSSTSYALRIGVSVIELYGSEFVISHTFVLKFYSTIIVFLNVLAQVPLHANDPI